MTTQRRSVELSIIIPCHNEEATLPSLFDSLARQQETDFEIVICDGESSDGTCICAEELAKRHGLLLSIVKGEKGRGAQLNAGAAASYGDTLLFLHADSHLGNPLALRKGLDVVASNRLLRKSDAIAAYFALCFDRKTEEPLPGYYYYECKARLNRRECTHGDQGLMLPRSFFQRIGPFSTFPPMLAESRLAEQIRCEGELLLLPDKIFTSARRFETEGLYRRQVMNAILMNCASLNWDTPFIVITGLYRTQVDTGHLPLAPFMEEIRRLISLMPFWQRVAFWYGTGVYVRGNAWQLAFMVDVRRNFRNRIPAGEGPTPMLALFDRFGEPLIDHPPARILAMMLTWIWFNLTRLHSRSINS